jgi:hypothetical protein
VCDIRFDVKQPFTPFALRTLIYAGACYESILLALHAPSLQTFVLSCLMDACDDSVISLPPRPALATLCVVGESTDSDAVKGLLFSNPGIRRLLLVGCGGTDKIVRLLEGDNTGSAVDPGATLLPSLGLLQVRNFWGEHTTCPLGPLLIRRPELRIEIECASGETYACGGVQLFPRRIKGGFQGHQSGYGVFESHTFRRRVG